MPIGINTADLIRSSSGEPGNDIQTIEAMKLQQLGNIRMKAESGATLSQEENDFIKQYENAQVGGLQKKDDKFTPPPPVPTPVIDESIIETIKTKIQATGEESLTPEEAETLNKYLAEPDVKEDPVYNINGVQQKKSEIASRMAAEYEMTPEQIAALGEKTIDKMIGDYIVRLNKDAWSKAGTQREQEVAKVRKEVGLQLYQITLQQQALREQGEVISRREERLREIVKNPINPNDLHDPATGSVDVQKMLLFQKQQNAMEELEELQRTKSELAQRSTQVEQRLVTARFKEFQDQLPEYKTSQDVTVIAAAQQRGMPVDQEDRIKFIEMLDIFRAADSLGIDPVEYQQILAKRGTLAVKPAATTREQTPPSPVTPSHKQRNADIIASIEARQARSRRLPPGGIPKVAQPNPKERAAWVIRNATPNAGQTDQGRSDRLTEAGY